MLDSWSREALVREVMETPRRACGRSAGMSVIERAGWWQMITPSFKHGAANEVALAVLDASETDEAIESTIAQYQGLGLRFRWTVGPDSRPHDLGERLERRGLVRHELRGMVRECTGLAGASDPRVTAERVGIANEPEYRQVSAIGWEMDPGPLLPYHAALLSDPTQRTQLFLARFDGEPAATGSSSSLGQASHLVGGVVLPAFRGHGLYRALVHARLVAAAEGGCELATTHAGAMSGPLLERLGFVTVCTFPTFLYAPG